MNELETANLINDVESIKPFMNMITTIMETPESALNENSIETFKNELNNGVYNTSMYSQGIKEIQDGFNSMNVTRAEAIENIGQLKDALKELIEDLKPSQNKKEILDYILNMLYNIFDDALKNYHLYDIELPIKLDEGAKMPTYAYDADAAADLYAMKDQIIPAHTIGNMIHTGVYIGLPEGWMAIIEPRSSIGSKTPLRLSNAQGIIDSGYRGELCILYDNISDSDYLIHKDDRIAQLMVRPIYRFKGVEVQELNETDRGGGGFGSTGK